MLAHTIYQTLAFDASIRDEGFTLAGTSEGRDLSQTPEWEGVADIILGKKEAFDAWVDGETACVFLYMTFLADVWTDLYILLVAEDHYNDIINSPDAWMIADEVRDEEAVLDLRPTNSARRVKALIEQVTGPSLSSFCDYLILIPIHSTSRPLPTATAIPPQSQILNENPDSHSGTVSLPCLLLSGRVRDPLLVIRASCTWCASRADWAWDAGSQASYERGEWSTAIA